MSKKNRILALVLAVIMLVGIMPLSLFATEEEAAAAEEAVTESSVLDALAAKATGSLYNGISVPEGAKSYYDKAYGNGIGSGSEKTNGIYVDSGWGDGSKSLVDTVDNLTGGTTDDTNTNITFNIIPTTGKGAFNNYRYFVSSFNMKVGEAFNKSPYRIRVRYAYKITTTYDADGNQVGDPVKATTETQSGQYPIGYNTSTDQLYVASACNDTGAAVPIGTWSSETYTNFGIIIDFEQNKAYYYVNGILFATDSSFLGATTSEPDESGNYTVTTFDFSQATLGLNPMFDTNNPYGGEYVQYGKTTAYFANDTSLVFDEAGSFLQGNKAPANGLFKFRDKYYYYNNGIIVTGQNVIVDDYVLELDAKSGAVTDYYKVTRSAFEKLTQAELEAAGATGYGATTVSKLSSATLGTYDGTDKITAYRYAEDGVTVETYEIDAVRVVDYTKNDHFTLLHLSAIDEPISYYSSEANLAEGKLTTLGAKNDDMQFFYDSIGADITYKATNGSNATLRNPDEDFVFSFDAMAGDAVFEYYASGKLQSEVPFFRARVYYEIDLAHDTNSTGLSYNRADPGLISVKIIDGVPYIYFAGQNCGEFSRTQKTNFTLLFKMDETKGPLVSLYVNGELKGTDLQLMSSVGKTIEYNEVDYTITDHYIQSLGGYYGQANSFDGHLFTYYPAKYYTASENLEVVTDDYTGLADNGNGLIWYENGAIAARGDAASVEAAAGEKYAELDSYNVSLSDIIHLNAYMKLGTLATEAGAYALLTVGGEEQRVDLGTLTEENGLYKITAKLSSIQIGKDVTLEIYDSEGNKIDILKDNLRSDSWSYSVQRYAEYILANEASYTTETIELVKAMLLYGSFAERHFTSKVSLSTARELTTYERLAVQYGTIGLFYTDVKVASSLFSYTTNDHTADVNLTATATDITAVGEVYLVLNSAIKIRIALNTTTAPESIEGGVLYTEEAEDGTVKYYVDITGLTAKDLNDVNTVTVDGNVIKVTGLAVADAVVTAESGTYDKTFTDLMKAMYLYYYRAVEYVNANA